MPYYVVKRARAAAARPPASAAAAAACAPKRDFKQLVLQNRANFCALLANFGFLQSGIWLLSLLIRASVSFCVVARALAALRLVPRGSARQLAEGALLLNALLLNACAGALPAADRFMRRFTARQLAAKSARFCASVALTLKFARSVLQLALGAERAAWPVEFWLAALVYAVVLNYSVLNESVPAHIVTDPVAQRGTLFSVSHALGALAFSCGLFRALQHWPQLLHALLRSASLLAGHDYSRAQPLRLSALTLGQLELLAGVFLAVSASGLLLRSARRGLARMKEQPMHYADEHVLAALSSPSLAQQRACLRSCLARLSAPTLALPSLETILGSGKSIRAYVKVHAALLLRELLSAMRLPRAAQRWLLNPICHDLLVAQRVALESATFEAALVRVEQHLRAFAELLRARAALAERGAADSCEETVVRHVSAALDLAMPGLTQTIAQQPADLLAQRETLMLLKFDFNPLKQARYCDQLRGLEQHLRCTLATYLDFAGALLEARAADAPLQSQRAAFGPQRESTAAQLVAQLDTTLTTLPARKNAHKEIFVLEKLKYQVLKLQQQYAARFPAAQ